MLRKRIAAFVTAVAMLVSSTSGIVMNAYADEEACTHAGKEVIKTEDVPATCEKYGYYYIAEPEEPGKNVEVTHFCADCGEFLNGENVVKYDDITVYKFISPTGHTKNEEGYTPIKGEEKHTFTCEYCGEIITKDCDGGSWWYANGKHKSFCGYCYQDMINTAEHVDSDSDGLCEVCNECVGEHVDEDADKECDKCDRTIELIEIIGDETVKVGEILPLTAKTFQKDVEVTWASLKTNIATVDNTGKVTGVATGTVTITATIDGTLEVATLIITVTADNEVTPPTDDEDNKDEDKEEVKPSTDSTTSSSESSSSESSSATTESTTPTNVSTSDMKELIKDTKKDEVAIEVGKDTKVKPAAIEEAMDAGVTVELKGEGYKWTFDPAKVDMTNFSKTFEAYVNVDAGVTMSMKSAFSKDGVDADDVQIITTEFSGELPGTVELEVTVDSSLKNKSLNCYYFNKDGKFELVASGLKAKNGKVSVELTHCSSYILTDKELTAVKSNPQTSTNPITTATPSTTTPVVTDKVNPSTGANDFVGTAVAMAVISVAGVAVLAKRK